MHPLRVTAAVVTVAATAFVPVAIANAAPGGTPGSPHPKPTATTSSGTPAAPTAPRPRPKFVVSQLTLGGARTVDVKAGPVTLPVRVQVKDFDRKYDVKTVTVSWTVDGVVQATALQGKLVGRSRIVSNWRATLATPATVAPGATVKVCLKDVTVAGASTQPVKATARGLAGRDCVTVVNTAPVAPVAPATSAPPAS